MLFIDADYFIGLYNKKDLLHGQCLKIAQSIQDDLITSFDVVDEVAIKLTYFMDKHASLTFLSDLIKERITIVYPTHPLFLAAKEIFAKQTSRKVSLTDCMNMAIAQEKKIREFLSFDKIYTKNGYKLYGQ